MDSISDIEEVCNNMRDFLIEKNKRYGNSALNPIRVFNKASTTTSLLCRLDDKLSRIKNSDELRPNDIYDTVGYLILLCIDKGWLNPKEFLD